MDLIKEKLVLDERVINEFTQILVEGDIIVPDVKPDMSVILQTDARTCIDKTETSVDKCSFSGRLELSVLYLAKNSPQPVQCIMLSAPFEDYMNVDGINKDMWVEVNVDITNIDYRMLNDRKVSYKAILGVTITADSARTHDVVVHIKEVPENQLQKRVLHLDRRIDNREERLMIKEKISVPSGKPNIREVLQSMVQVSNKDVRVGTGRVSINGELNVTTLYKADNEERVIEFLENELPFSGTVEIPGVKDDMFADISLVVMDQMAKIEPDQDGESRVVSIEANIGVLIRVHSQETLEILEDAYCINKSLELSKTPIKYPRLISRNKNQTQVKEVIQIDDECPDILQILRVNGKVKVDDLRVIEDKVLVEGYVETDILYVAQSDERPIYSHKALVPYKQIIETKGARGNMQVKLAPTIDHVGFNMLSNRELELRLLIGFNTQIIEHREMSMITDISFQELDKSYLDSFASMTVYIVQKDDNLWKVAKRYNTSIDDIREINELDGEISAGQRLLILKKN